jgi:hypothetical protein
MFPLQPSLGRPRPSYVPSGALAHSGHSSLAAWMVRFGLLVAPLSAALPGAASAQALGTMQVTARVLSGGPSWVGLAEAQALTRQVPLSPSGGTEIRRAGLVQARAAALGSTGGPRRLLITIDYLRN